MQLAISLPYRKGCATVRITYNTSNACKPLNIGCTSRFILDRNSRQHGEYAAVYESYFHTCCGFSFYDRVCNSILVYEYGMQKERTLF